MAEGPFNDEMVRHFVMTAQTHEAIRKHAEEMAEVLAAAAIASNKARGDSADYALDRWLEVIKLRAKELIRENQKSKLKALNAPDVIDG